MGKLYSLISALLLTVSAAFAAAPDSYEWWFDQDVTSAQSGSISGRSIDLQIDTSNLPKGIHYFNLRLAEGGSAYGSVYRKIFHSFGQDSGAISYEYWFDSDYDSKISGDMSVGSNTLDLDISALPKGAHYFNCRLGYGGDEWGSVYRKMILNLIGDVDAVGFEYWIDDEYTSRTEGELHDGQNSYLIDLTGFRKGLHRFNYRIRTGNGTWGPVFTQHFYAVSNPERFTQYEYWLDNDYANRVVGNATGNPTSFEVDLSAFDKSGGAHYFNLRTRDGDGDWSPIYHKLLVFDKTEKRRPIIGYRHFLNGNDLGYVEVERQLVDSYMFEVNLPDSVYPSIKNTLPSFDGDRVYIAGADSIDYTMQVRTEFGWATPNTWKLEVANGFSTTAVPMQINSRHTFAAPAELEFAAMKFTASGDSIYFRSDIPVALDIYKGGERVVSLTPEQVKGMSMLRLTAGEYFGVLHSVEDAEATNLTLHLMDTPNQVPMPTIVYEDETVSISCSRDDAVVRYTLNGNDPDGDSDIYSEPFRLTRNATVKAKAWVEGSDIEPSAVASYTVDSYKTAAPVAEFDLAKRLLTLTSETKDASIFYTHEYDPADSLGGVWTDYTEPIQIRKNCMVFSRAVFDGYNDSEITVTEITSLPDSVPMPRIDFKEGTVEISCANGDAEIHYTIDNPDLTAESPRYTGPFALDRNATIRAFAFIPGLDIEPSAVTTKVVDSYKVAAPRGSFDASTRMLTIGCDTDDARIFYAFDPSEDWTEYSAPIAITRNCIVYAKATRDGYNDSEVAEIRVTELANSVAAPVIDFNEGTVEINCANGDAEIHYTIDDPDLTAESPRYTGPFALDRNATIRAFAFIPGLDIEPSAVTTKVVDSYKVAAPRGSFDASTRMLTIGCDTDDARIFYAFYPSEDWTEYSAPISITRNCIVYAKATRDGYNDSEVAEIRVTELANSVAAPVIDFNEGTVEINCANGDAEIHYTIDDPDLTAESPRYTGPFALDRNATIRAFAFIPGLDIEPSAVTTKVVDSYKVAAPRGSFDASTRMLTIGCDTDDATIFYAFDPSEDWTEYSAPIAITRNCIVYAKATRDGYNDSEVAEIQVTELANSVAAPVIDFNEGTVEINCANGDAEIHYTIDDPNLTAESPRYTGPFALDRNATIRAFAFIPGLDIEPSAVTTKVVDSYKVADVQIDYHGHNVSLSTEEGATIRYTIDSEELSDGMTYTGEFDAEGLRTIRAVAVKDGYRDSDIAVFQITFYADEYHAETVAEGLLASAFEWDSELPTKVTDFRIEGRLNADDYAFIRSMSELRHLDLEDVADAHIPDNAFRDSRLISISLPADMAECGDSILSGTPLLSSVIWNSESMNVGEDLTLGLENPNVLLYVPASTDVPDSSDLNIVRQGIASEITLHYGHPYYAARNIHANRVSLTHDFTQTTAIDTCRGWETIVLPFSPTEYTHEVNGPALPFASWEGQEDSRKPFWLYQATSDGWEAARDIKACVPYIISMPENPDYVKEFNLGGKVTFSANNVNLGPEISFAESWPWMEGTNFEGTFMPVDAAGILSLNVGSNADGLQPGSTFVPDGSTLPFGAYVSGATRRSMPLFGGSNSVELPLIVDSGLLIETPAPGILRICSGRERRVAVVTATGVTIRMLHLKPGEPQTLEGLTRDLYIVAGRKVMVR